MRVSFKNKLCVTCSVITLSLALLSAPVAAFAGDGSGSMQVRASVTQKETQGSDEKPTEAPTKPAEKPTQPTQKPTAPTEEPTQAPKDEPTTAPDDNKPTETPTEQETESITQEETTDASTKSTEVKTEPASKPRAIEPTDTDVTVDEQPSGFIEFVDKIKTGVSHVVTTTIHIVAKHPIVTATGVGLIILLILLIKKRRKDDEDDETLEELDELEAQAKTDEESFSDDIDKIDKKDD